MTAPTLVHVNDLWKRYRLVGAQIDVLRGVSLQVAAGELVIVTGNSGAGKTTLLNILAALDYPDRGEAIVAGVSVAHLSRRAGASYRNRTIGIIFQSYNLLPQLTALENVLLPTVPRGGANPRRARDLLAMVGLSDRAAHRPSELSGGEQQRVAIARALANDPALLLADEPTGNLDDEATHLVRELFRQVASERGKAVVVVSHDRSWAVAADRSFTLHAGTLRPTNPASGCTRKTETEAASD
jgi:ABC-type lipoprotein export system ATPase subunit